jgi:hypothetical protein
MKRARSLRFSHLLTASAVAVAALVAGCNDLIEDSTFRAWCGDALCNWTLESGSVRKAPTWHPNDYGVELVDTPTAISQSTDKTAKCITFTTVADIEPSAQVTIGLDFNRDGTVEYEQPIAATGFHQAETQVTAPALYDGIRFVVTKKGAGRAVLAEIRAKAEGQCSAPPIVLRDQPLGTPCSAADGCASGVCCTGLCAECCTGPEPSQVVACPESGACETRVEHSIRMSFLPAMPAQCDPGAHDRPAGAECVADSDCASGACDGAKIGGIRATPSPDGGLEACEPSIDDGAGGEPDAGSADDACVVSSVQGGRCL